MNPYVSSPDDIPATDNYVDLPFYGRYFPRLDDFHVDPRHVKSRDADSAQYWASVVDMCNESIRIYPADEGGRDVFALGSVVVKSSHLHKPRDGQRTEIDYSYADANETQAVAIARSVFKAVRVPEIYFAGKVHSLELIGIVFITDNFADQWTPGIGPGKNSRCRFERRLAVPITSPEGII